MWSGKRADCRPGLFRLQSITLKVRNLHRNLRATLCVFVEAFTGPWVQIEGTTEILTGASVAECGRACACALGFLACVLLMDGAHLSVCFHAFTRCEWFP